MVILHSKLFGVACFTPLHTGDKPSDLHLLFGICLICNLSMDSVTRRLFHAVAYNVKSKLA